MADSDTPAAGVRDRRAGARKEPDVVGGYHAAAENEKLGQLTQINDQGEAAVEHVTACDFRVTCISQWGDIAVDSGKSPRCGLPLC